MNTRNRFLSVVLLVLIGILIGGGIVLWQQGAFISDHSKVQYTKIKTSNKPFLDGKELKKLGPRFLFKNVVRHVKPSVVYITSVVSLSDHPIVGHKKRSFWNHFHAQRARTVGSGVIISENGYIITNDHVIRGAVDNGITVELNNKRVFDARIAGTDLTTDLAVLKIDAKNLPAITFGNSNSVTVGQWVLAIGNPFRLRSTVTAGIISALSRRVQINGEIDSRLRINNYIQTDAAINKGNSGGPLVNTSGQLIGINTAIATKNGNYQGYGFAIPSNLVRKVSHDLIEYGKVHRALLGVSIRSIGDRQAQKLGLSTIKGVEVVKLAKDGAAHKSDIQKEDVILAVDGNPVNSANQLQEEIAVHHPGDTVQLKVWRNNHIINRDVKLGSVKPSDLALNKPPKNRTENNTHQFKNDSERGIHIEKFSLGFKVMALAKRKKAQHFDLFIARVYPSSQAAQQGLKEGDAIKKVNGKKVESLKELKAQINAVNKKGGTILLEVETPGGAKGFYVLKRQAL
jgi:Do/DeqQ family serine protease